MTARVRVLCVEGSAERAISEALAGDDRRFDIEAVPGAETALGRLDESVDCVVAAHDPPGTNRIELLRAVRADDPAVPFVLCPVDGSEALASEAVAVGASEYVPRSRGETLADAVERAVDRADGEWGQPLRRLHEATRALIEADAPERMAAIASEAADDILDLWLNGIHFHEEGRGLVPVAVSDTSDELLGDVPVLGTDSLAWQAYESGERVVYDDVRESDAVHDPATPMRAEVIYPLGDHGVFIVSSTEPNAFDERDVLLGDILAANLRSALDQAAQARDLRRKADRLEAFAGVVSHDLRSPLSVASGRIELARETGDDEHFEAALSALDRGQTLLEDLLTLAREGKQVGDPSPVALASVAEDCWQTVESEGATLTVETDRTVPADRTRLRQLLENLLRNSVEHGADGDGRLSITVGDLDDGFYVADDGVGLAAHVRASVNDSDPIAPGGDTGIGLAIVEEVANSHGWQVTATEGADGGARFEITGVDGV